MSDVKYELKPRAARAKYEHYQSSNRFHPLMLAFVAAAMVASALFAWVHQAVLRVSTYLVFDTLSAFVFAALVALMGVACTYFGRCRSTKVAPAVGGALAGAALVASLIWGRPDTFTQWFTLFMDAVLLFAGTCTAMWFVSRFPYCETCDGWMRHQSGTRKGLEERDVRRYIFEGRLEDLFALPDVETDDPKAPEIKLEQAYCSCIDGSYLTVEASWWGLGDRKDELRRETKTLLDKARMPQAVAEEFMSRVMWPQTKPPLRRLEIPPEEQ